MRHMAFEEPLNRWVIGKSIALLLLVSINELFAESRTRNYNVEYSTIAIFASRHYHLGRMFLLS